MSGSNPNDKAYDTGLFDPTIHDNQVVALYDTDANAHAARDKLVAAGVEPGSVQVVARSADKMAGGVDYEAGDQGIWGAIKSLFVPDDEAHAYNHAVGRGHAMVVVTPSGNSDRHHIIEVLESTDPIDFDAKLEEWRQSGYDYSSTGSNTDDRNTTRAMPADYAVNATTVTDNIPASAGGTASSHDTVGNTVERGVEKAGAAVAGAAAAVGGALGLTDTDRTTDHTAATTSAMPVRGAAPSVQSTVAPSTGTVGDDETIKIVEERLRVGKREVARGAVRVRSYVVERPVEEQVRLHEENVTIERRPVDRAATDLDASAFQDRTIEMTTRSEEAVVSKDARVVEEIEIRKDATDRVETVRDTVRRTEVDVDDTRNTGMATTGGSKATVATDADGAGAGTGMPASAATVKGADPKSTGPDTSSATGSATTSGMNAPRK